MRQPSGKRQNFNDTTVNESADFHNY